MLAQERDLVFHLVVKNVFVYTINIAGLKVGGTTGALWSRHREFAKKIARETLAVQMWLTGERFSEARVIPEVEKGIHGDPDHKCTGRSAPDRCARLVAPADRAGIDIPEIRSDAASGNITAASNGTVI